jgi:hypothetical protein
MAAKFLNDLRDRLQAHEKAAAQRESAATPSDLYCSRCLATLKEIQKLDGYLLHTVVGPKGETKLICSICLAGF